MMRRPVSLSKRFASRWVRPLPFDTFPPPVRGTALQVLLLYVEELIANGSVDGATGDAVDGLIDAWLAQWREELQPGLADRQAFLQYLTNLARARVAAAQARADAARFAHDDACAAYDTACGVTASTIIPQPRLQKELSNGVHHSESR